MCSSDLAAKKRRSFLRRYVVRSLVWMLAAGAVLALLLGRLVDTETVRDRLRRLAETKVSERLAVEVRIGGLDINLLPLQVEVTDLEIDGTDGQRFAVLPRGVARAFVEGLFEPRITLYRVELEQPTIDLRFSENGVSNIPRYERRKKRVTIRTRELEISDGEIRIGDLRVPLDVEALEIEADLIGLGRNAAQGTLRVDQLLVGLAGGEADLGAVDVRARTIDGGVEIESGTLAGPDLGGAFEGRWLWRDSRPGEFAIDAEVDTALLRRLGLAKDVISGAVRYVGDLHWEGSDWSANGRLTSAQLSALGRNLRAVRADVRVSPEAISLTGFEAAYGAGRLEGAARVELSERPLTELDLKVADLDLRDLLAEQNAPVRGLASRVGGDLRYRFFLDAPVAGDGWGQFDLQPALQRESFDRPVNGTVALLIDNGEVALEVLRLRTSSQQIDVVGSHDLALRQGQFRYELATESLPELIDFASQELTPAVWVPETGRGTVRGDLNFDGTHVSSLVEFDLLEVAAPGFAAEELTGSLVVDRSGIENLRLDMSRRHAGLLVTGSIPFDPPAGAGEDAEVIAEFEIGVEAVGWPSTQFAPWLPMEVPIDGPVTGSLRIAGVADALSGSARLSVEPALRSGSELGDLEATIHFDPRATEVESLRLVNDECVISGSGRLGTGDGQIDFELDSQGCSLAAAPFASLLPVPANATLGLAATLEGSLENPEVSARVDLAEIEIPGRDRGDLGVGALEFDWHGSRLSVDGGIPGVFAVVGSGTADATAIDLTVGLEIEDLGLVVASAGGPYLANLDGDASGRVAVRARAAAGWEPSVELEWDRVGARYDERELRNLEPVRITWCPDTLSIESLFLGDDTETSDLFVSGTAALPAGELALNLQASLDADWLALLDPELDIRGGAVDLLANVGGTLSQPRLVGQGSLREGQMVVPGELLSLEGMEGLLLFYPEQVVLDQLTASAAGGRILASGRIGLPENGASPDYRFQLTARDFSLRYPAGWLLSGDTELVLSSIVDGREIEGSVALTRALYSQDVPLGIGQLMQVLFQRRRVEVEEVDEFLAATQLNVLVVGDRALRVRNNLADLYGQIDLAVLGTAARPIVFGDIELERDGTLDYSDTEYSIDRGLLSFVNPHRIEPVVDLVATTTTREYEVTMNLSGPVDKINATFASDPPLADLEIVSLLATGEASASDSQSSGLDAGSFLYGQAASLIANRANNLFGFDKLRIDPLTGESGRLSSARVTVGKQLTRDVFATYSYDPSEAEDQILQLEWQVDRDFALVFTQNGDGSYAVDAQWEKHF